MSLFDEVIENVGKPYAGKGFTHGTHEVIIGEAEAKAKDTKKAKDCATIEVLVFDKADNDKQATATLWFHTDGAAKMSVTKVLGLLIHNVGEEKKDAVRELGKKLFGSIDDSTQARDVAAKLMRDKLVGKKAYLVAEPRGNYTTTAYGDLWHYPAEPQNKVEEIVTETGGEDITAESGDEIPKFEENDL